MNNHGYAQRYWEHIYHGKQSHGRSQDVSHAAGVTLLHIDSHFDVNYVPATESVLAAIQSSQSSRGTTHGDHNGKRHMKAC